MSQPKAVEPHIIEPYKPGNTVVGEPYEFTEEISKGLYAVSTYVDYKNKKGELIEEYLLRVKYIETADRLPNTSDLLNMTIPRLEVFLKDDTGYYSEAFINNMVKPVLKRKIKEAYRVHKTWSKCLINPVLRKIQFWTDKPFVIASKITDEHEFVRYAFKRVKLSTEKTNPRKETYYYKFSGCWFKTIQCFLFGE